MQTSTGGVLLKPAMLQPSRHCAESQSIQCRGLLQNPHLALIEIHHSHKVQWVGIVVVIGARAHVHEALDEASLTGRIVHCRAGQGGAATQPSHGRHPPQIEAPTLMIVCSNLRGSIQQMWHWLHRSGTQAAVP